jgi:hypothetical protein
MENNGLPFLVDLSTYPGMQEALRNLSNLYIALCVEEGIMANTDVARWRSLMYIHMRNAVRWLQNNQETVQAPDPFSVELAINYVREARAQVVNLQHTDGDRLTPKHQETLNAILELTDKILFTLVRRRSYMNMNANVIGEISNIIGSTIGNQWDN